jgi:hypothetical protein
MLRSLFIISLAIVICRSSSGSYGVKRYPPGACVKVQSIPRIDLHGSEHLPREENPTE